MLALLLAVALPLAAAEKWVDAYNKGVNAVNTRNYKVGVTELSKAIAENPNEGTAVRTRNAIITYVPHFWLGIAKFNTGDVDGALREWRISEEQGAIVKTQYYAGMKDWIARAQTEKQRNAANAASGAKKAAADAISRALATQVEALSAGGDRTENYRSAQRMLQTANSQYNKAGVDVSAYATAEQTAARATALFLAAAEDGKRLKAARNAPKPKPEKPIQVVVPFDDGAKPVVTPPKPEPPKPEPVKPVEEPATPTISQAKAGAEEAVQQLRRNLNSAGRTARGNAELQSYVRRESREADTLRKQLGNAKNDAEYQNIARIAGERDAALAKKIAEAKRGGQAIPPVPTETTGKIAGPPPSNDLGIAYRAFAAGDLAGSEAQLTKILGERASGEAYLLRGVARYTRAMLSRDPDPLLAAATSDFKAALQQNRLLRLDAKAFSPKLIAFFEDVRSKQ